MATTHPSSQNSILNMLTAPQFAALLHSDLELVTSPTGEVLYTVGGEIQHVYFPRTALVSLVGISTAGESIEVGMVGFEGFVGIPLLLGASCQQYQAVTQIGGTLWRLPKDALVPINGEPFILTNTLLRYAHVRLIQIVQSAICNRFHTLRQRLCRWLLTARDRRQSDDLAFTKEYLAEMIGSHRPGVATTLAGLQRLKWIESHRGGVSILRGKDLETASCECYAMVKKEAETFVTDCMNHGRTRRSWN